MAHRFKIHYTVEQARTLLPQVRQWLQGLKEHARSLQEDGDTIAKLLETGDLGGDRVNRYVRALAEFTEIVKKFREREIQIKDLDRGLLDFPAIIGGKEVFLCWEEDEDDIEFWHDLDTGYQGRERLP
ncbi:MAG: DUF2203 domain-containing protein [Verrucomicrobiota bacterium]